MTKSETPWALGGSRGSGGGWERPRHRPPPPPARLLLLCQKRLARYCRPGGELRIKQLEETHVLQLITKTQALCPLSTASASASHRPRPLQHIAYSMWRMETQKQ
jgi:hypothetical protein